MFYLMRSAMQGTADVHTHTHIHTHTRTVNVWQLVTITMMKSLFMALDLVFLLHADNKSSAQQSWIKSFCTDSVILFEGPE